MKTLYFEGVGMSEAAVSKATIGNCRIRTAFHLNDGRGVYLEISGTERTKNSPPHIYRWKYTGFVDSCYCITDDVPNDDQNLHKIGHNWIPDFVFKYTEEEILRFVNSLGASFDAIKVLPDLGGYRVFRKKYSNFGPDCYHYGDEFLFDPDVTARREAIYLWFYDLEMKELKEDRMAGGNQFCHSPLGHDFPCFSLWVDEYNPGLLHLLRHFMGYNKHWTIRTDSGDNLQDCLATMQETKLGRYGC